MFSQPALEGHHRDDVVRPREAVLFPPMGVILSDTSIVQPDIVYLDTARLGRIRRRGIEGTPALVVESLSPSTGLIDRSTKRQLYSSAGLTSLKDRLLAADMLTGQQIAAQLGVRRTTIGRWRSEGCLEARICNEMGQWLYAPHQERPPDGQPPSEHAAPCAKPHYLI